MYTVIEIPVSVHLYPLQKSPHNDFWIFSSSFDSLLRTTGTFPTTTLELLFSPFTKTFDLLSPEYITVFRIVITEDVILPFILYMDIRSISQNVFLPTFTKRKTDEGSTDIILRSFSLLDFFRDNIYFRGPERSNLFFWQRVRVGEVYRLLRF